MFNHIEKTQDITIESAKDIKKYVKIGRKNSDSLHTLCFKEAVVKRISGVVRWFSRNEPAIFRMMQDKLGKLLVR